MSTVQPLAGRITPSGVWRNPHTGKLEALRTQGIEATATLDNNGNTILAIKHSTIDKDHLFDLEWNLADRKSAPASEYGYPLQNKIPQSADKYYAQVALEDGKEESLIVRIDCTEKMWWWLELKIYISFLPPPPPPPSLLLILKMIPKHLQKMFQNANANVAPIAYDNALHKKHRCAVKEAYNNVRNVFLEDKGSTSTICIGYALVADTEGSVWIEHCWIRDNKTHKNIDVTTDSFTHVYGMPMPTPDHILAARPLHTY